MKKLLILAFVLAASLSSFGQILTLASGGGNIKTNAITGVVSYSTDMSASDNSQGPLVIELPTVPLADLESGACLPSGGSFSLKLTGPTVMTLKGTLVSNTGSCPNGPFWQLETEGDLYITYQLSFGLSDGAMQGHCVLRTVYLAAPWDGKAGVSVINCLF